MNAIFSPPAAVELDLPEVPDGYEMIEGELVRMPNMGEQASVVEGDLFALLHTFCQAHDLGRVYPPGTAFRCFPSQRPTVRKPDAAFVRKERLSSRPGKRDLRVAPDLAVEVISPKDKAEYLDRKIDQYLSVGVRLIWVVNPDTRTVLIYRVDGSVARLRADQELTGEDVLPGFRCRVDAFLPPAPPPGAAAVEAPTG
jgi:Uma2 family endonuclease